jgi:hypothetical protein
MKVTVLDLKKPLSKEFTKFLGNPIMSIGFTFQNPNHQMASFSSSTLNFLKSHFSFSRCNTRDMQNLPAALA